MLTAFTAGLLLITVSELGDKTFFIAAVLAMRHSRRWVFIGAIGALTVMTVLSVLLGRMVSVLPTIYVQWLEVLVFLAFGLKLLLDARQMSHCPNPDEQKEALQAVEQSEKQFGSQPGKRLTPIAVILQSFGLTFVAEWGDRTQFTTIALAAANHPVGVTIGAVVGHAICALIAVLCGRFICGYISERTVTLIGGGLFLVFAIVGLWEML